MRFDPHRKYLERADVVCLYADLYTTSARTRAPLPSVWTTSGTWAPLVAASTEEEARRE